MSHELARAVAAFVAAELGVRADELQPHTRLLHDLGCDGSDAVALLTAFGRRFGVTLAEFDVGLHFGPEAAPNRLAHAHDRAARRSSERLRKRPLTLAHLVEAVGTGRLRNSEAEAL